MKNSSASASPLTDSSTEPEQLAENQTLALELHTDWELHTSAMIFYIIESITVNILSSVVQHLFQHLQLQECKLKTGSLLDAVGKNQSGFPLGVCGREAESVFMNRTQLSAVGFIWMQIRNLFQSEHQLPEQQTKSIWVTAAGNTSGSLTHSELLRKEWCLCTPMWCICVVTHLLTGTGSIVVVMGAVLSHDLLVIFIYLFPKGLFGEALWEYSHQLDWTLVFESRKKHSLFDLMSFENHISTWCQTQCIWEEVAFIQRAKKHCVLVTEPTQRCRIRRRCINNNPGPLFFLKTRSIFELLYENEFDSTIVCTSEQENVSL